MNDPNAEITPSGSLRLAVTRWMAASRSGFGDVARSTIGSWVTSASGAHGRPSQGVVMGSMIAPTAGCG